MNKEVKAHIDSLNDDEKYSYLLSVKTVERLFDLCGIAVLFFGFMWSGIFLVGGAVIALFVAKLAGTLKEARIYIEEELELR